MRPFFPQLQRTFLKMVGDGDATVRASASLCLRAMAPYHAKLDLILNDLASRVTPTAGSVTSPTTMATSLATPAQGESKEACLYTLSALLTAYMKKDALLPEATRSALLASVGGTSPMKWPSEEPMAVQKAIAYLAGTLLHLVPNALELSKVYLRGLPEEVVATVVQALLSCHRPDSPTDFFVVHPDMVQQLAEQVIAAPNDQVLF